MKKLSIHKKLNLIVMIVLSFSFALLGCTQKEEIATLKEGQETIIKELEEIKQLMQTKRPPRAAEFRPVVINIDDDPFKGDKNAKVTLIDFSDYQ